MSEASDDFDIVDVPLRPQEGLPESPHSDNPLRGTINEALQRESEMYRSETGEKLGETEGLRMLYYNDKLALADAEFKKKCEFDNCPEIDIITFEAQTILGRGVNGEVYKAKKMDGDIIQVKVQDKEIFRGSPDLMKEVIRERKMQWAFDSDFVIR